MTEPGADPPEPAEPADRWAEPIASLAPFATAAREPGFAFGAWHASERGADGAWSMPWYELADGGSRLVAAAGVWIVVGFHWRDWVDTAEAQTLIDDPAAMLDATPEQIAHLLTALIRSERFFEGQLEGAWQSGLFLRIVDRVAALAAGRGGTPDRS
jgi:hypothetical protein